MRSARRTRDNSAGDTQRQMADTEVAKRPRNPFRAMDDQQMPASREAQRRKRQEDRAQLTRVPIHDRVETRPASAMPRKMSSVSGGSNRSEARAAVQTGRRQKTNLTDFLQQKREIFLSQLAIDTKREELERLDAVEREEHEYLKAKEAEIQLFRSQFQAFVEMDGKATMEARHAAEMKAKQRIQLSKAIKEVSNEISSLRDEITRNDGKRAECQAYQQFIESLTPSEWRSSHPSPEIYFKDPKQLVDILVELEEHNMFLIQHCQDAEETVERYRLQFTDLLAGRDGSIVEMHDKKALKEKELSGAQSRNIQYKTSGDFRKGNELGEKELETLQQSIADFHILLGFETAKSNDTATMLSRIEGKMEEMTSKLETLQKNNPKLLRELAQIKEAERREQERAEKNAIAQMEKEEKTQRAIQNALMPIKKRTGRPVVSRTTLKVKDTREARELALRKKLEREAADADLLYGEIWD